MSDFTKVFAAAMAAAIAAGASAADFTSGVLLLNEGQYGSPASICHLSSTGEWSDRAFAAANGGATLGNTGCFAQIYGENIYIVSKDPNATGAVLTKADAATLVMKASTSEPGFAGAQGRAFLAVDTQKGYLGTSKGVAVVRLDDLSVLGTIEGILDKAGKEAECGNMVRLNDRVFIATKSPFVYVVDPATDAVVRTLGMAEITGDENAIAASLVVASDGSLWVSVAGNADGGTLPYLVKITQSDSDASKIETAVVNIPEEIYAPANSWYAWTPDAFCASPVAPVLYWNGGASSWASNQLLFKYDIEKGEFSQFYEFPSDQFLYGASMRVNPADGNIYIAYNTGANAWTNVTTLAVMNADAQIINRYPMSVEYWFPELPFFPDNAAPVAAAFESPFAVDADMPETVIDLRAIATDADSHDALMVKSLHGNPNPELGEMEVKHGVLTVRPASGANGSGIANVKVNSNGKEIVVALPLAFTSTSGVEDVAATESSTAAYRESATSIRLLGSGSAKVYTLSGALVADEVVDGEAVVGVSATPVIVRFGGKSFKL